MSSDPTTTAEPAFGQGGITRLGFRLRDLFRARDWQALRAEIGLEEIWYFDAPLAVDDALDRADAGLRDYGDIEVELDRIQKSERTDDQASGTYTCVLMGFDPGQLRQLEVGFDLHLGFERKGEGEDDDFEGWRLERLGVTPPTPEVVRHPDPEPTAEPATGAALAVDDDGCVTVYVPMRLPLGKARELLLEGIAEPGIAGTPSPGSATPEGPSE